MLSIIPRFAQQALTNPVKYCPRHVNQYGASHPVTTIVAPAHWSQNAVDTLANKYARKRGVPDQTIDRPGFDHLPRELRPSVPALNAIEGPETDARWIFRRIAGCWAYHAIRFGYFKSSDAVDFFWEIYYALERQLFAPASPQWFNTGLWWAYGIEGEPSGLWRFRDDLDQVVVEECDNAYENPLVMACFINSLDDNLTGPRGIMDLLHREARIFRFGGGAGVNASNLRGKGEPLSGGGRSSGAISFLKTLDTSAGSIKSGGVTRRAARLVQLNDDHPDLLEFIDWKVREEEKVAAMSLGHRLLRTDPAAVRENLGANFADSLAATGPYLPHLDPDFEGEAYTTVTGQNANNTVRVTDAFMRAVESDSTWELKPRTQGLGAKPITVKAAEVWERIVKAAWRCADPGLQFHDTINDWHTCLNDEEIVATNPCAEYHFVNDTSCNLASVHLGKFFDPETGIDLDGFTHMCRLATIGLDITVSMAGYPDQVIARRAQQYRTLGLGYCDLGGVLMRFGLPYDSDEGRAVAANITSLMHSTAYITSAELANNFGPCPAYGRNREHFSRVIQNHAAALENLPLQSRRHTPVNIVKIPHEALPDSFADLRSYALKAAQEMVRQTSQHGTRNAQVTLLAPTGTIGMVLDVDTTGCEPDFALKKHKVLAGGGSMEIVNQSVRKALQSLGYDEIAITDILTHVERTGTVEGCQSLDARDLAVFDCANRAIEGGRSLSALSHVRMMAVVQPFLSGAISKTINLPAEATMEDVSEVYWRSWLWGIKANALYRDGSKLNQPLNVKKETTVETVASTGPGTLGTAPVTMSLKAAPDAAEKIDVKGIAVRPSPPIREHLPGRRPGGYTQKFRIGGHTVYLRTGEYADGRLGEIFISAGIGGTLLGSMVNAFAVAVSLGLQHGVPLSEYVDAFAFTQFEPSGPVSDHPRIRFAKSLLDAIARDLGINYLGRDELAHTSPADNDDSFGRDTEPTTPAAPVRKSPYTGNPCPNCKHVTVRRNGACEKCDTCGWDSGCG